MWRLIAIAARRLGSRLLLVAVVLVVSVVSYAIYLHVSKSFEAEEIRLQELADLRAQQEVVARQLSMINETIQQAAEEIRQQEERLAQARRVAERTAELLGWWRRLWMNEQERALLERRREYAERAASESENRIRSARSLHGQGLRELNDLKTREGALQERIDLLLASENQTVNVLRQSWEYLRNSLLLVAFSIVFGPILWKVFCYYGWAGFFQRYTPQPVGEAAGIPSCAPANAAIPVTLRPGEQLLVRPSCAHASDEKLTRFQRWLLDWRHPFTSAAARLYGLYGYAIRDTPDNTASEAPHQLPVVTIAPPDSSGATDCIEVEVPQGHALILRPAALLGVVIPKDGSLRVRSRWQFNRRAAWLALRFRVLEYHGPCRLIVVGGRGLRGELSDGFGRRVRPGSVVAFTPALAWGCVRAETFWGFALAGEPLFDELYRGRGWLLVQESSPEGPGGAAARWWDRFTDSLLRILGI